MTHEKTLEGLRLEITHGVKGIQNKDTLNENKVSVWPVALRSLQCVEVIISGSFFLMSSVRAVNQKVEAWWLRMFCLFKTYYIIWNLS